MKVLETIGDTAYVQYRHALAKPLDKPLYTTINWFELAQQKDDLLRILGGEIPYVSALKRLEGLVTLIDAIQDDAEAAGHPVVWACPVSEVDEWFSEESEARPHE
jgi:hypothetical protein